MILIFNMGKMLRMIRQKRLKNFSKEKINRVLRRSEFRKTNGKNIVRLGFKRLKISLNMLLLSLQILTISQFSKVQRVKAINNHLTRLLSLRVK